VLPEKFSKKREERDVEKPFYTKIKDAVLPPSPLKPRLRIAIKRILLHVQRLDKAASRLSERDKFIFKQVVGAYSKRDMLRAEIFASELGEIRKMEKMIMHTRLALEQIVLRLRTVSELGDVVSTLSPTVGVLRSVRTGMVSVLPEAERELGQIGSLLSQIVIHSGQSTGLNINFEETNEDAQKILNDAATLAGQKVKEKFPELPVEVPSIREKASAKT
jgi:division protein CdvB (Snf7/Vps24/ESCRT-III family)